MMAAISCTVRSAIEQRSRPVRRFEASLKAVSDWMPRVAVGLAGVGSSPGFSVVLVFMITVLLPMGFLSYRRCAGVRCTDDLVECFDGDLDMFSLENERRKKAKDRVAGAVDDDVAIHELGGYALRQISRVEFSAKHQTDSADIDDAFMAGRKS